MFRCEVTGKVTKPREPMTKVVVGTRTKTYVNHKIDPLTLERVRVVSTGWEIVKEISASQEGVAKLREERGDK